MFFFENNLSWLSQSPQASKIDSMTEKPTIRQVAPILG